MEEKGPRCCKHPLHLFNKNEFRRSAKHHVLGETQKMYKPENQNTGLGFAQVTGSLHVTDISNVLYREAA